jgi:hypothetical protein
MDLTSEEVERYLNIIFTGMELFNLNGKLLILKQPDNMVRAQADLIYDKALKRAKDSGILSIADWEELIIKRNLFTQADKDKLEELQTQKHAQEVILIYNMRVKYFPENLGKTVGTSRSWGSKMLHRVDKEMNP